MSEPIEKPKKWSEKVYKAQVIGSWDSTEELKKMWEAITTKPKKDEKKKEFRLLWSTTAKSQDGRNVSTTAWPTVTTDKLQVSVWVTDITMSDEGGTEEHGGMIWVTWKIETDSPIRDLFGWIKRKKKK